MPARLSIHVPHEAVATRVIDEADGALIGRSSRADIVVAHDSVSRRHARIVCEDGRWIVEDLESKNGVRIEGRRVARAELDLARWLAIGDVFCEFERITPEAVRHLAARAGERRETSRIWHRKLSSAAGVDGLIGTLLAGIVDIAECRRGFLLIAGRDGGFSIRAQHAIDPVEIASAAFSGSRGAVDRAIAGRRAVFLGDRRDLDDLGGRESVVARGIRAIAALPLEHEGRLLGVVYADTDEPAREFSDLDAELLGAFAARASAALAADEIAAALKRVELSLDDARAAPSHWARAAVPESLP